MDIEEIKAWYTDRPKSLGPTYENIGRLISAHDAQAEELTLLRASLEVCQKNEADYKGEISRLKIDLAEADRRAGSAERREHNTSASLSALTGWRDKQKGQAGYDRSVSFDVVWKETLAKALRAEGLEKALEALLNLSPECGCDCTECVVTDSCENHIITEALAAEKGE
jgi:hypothetical protein